MTCEHLILKTRFYLHLSKMLKQEKWLNGKVITDTIGVSRENLI